MKSGRRRSFWPLSPTAAAQSLERTCWLAAAGLILALALASDPVANASARPPSGIAPEKGGVLILHRRCVDRILGQARIKREEPPAEAADRGGGGARVGGPAPAAARHARALGSPGRGR